jgi:coenzyme F420-0:L-glutamate ligase/coenzyme F420-1:gamma-L-glutamate ligase
LADLVASAATLLLGQAAEGMPVVVVQGKYTRRTGSVRELVRLPEMDLFK